MLWKVPGCLHTHCMQGLNGDWLGIDLGLDACQPWPSSMQLLSPFAYQYEYGSQWNGGPPTDFSVDTSGAAIQPAADSADWNNLLIVKGFEIPLVPATGGTFSHTFQILPEDSTPAPSLSGSLDDLTISLSDPIGTNLTINLEDAFPVQGRDCCPSFAAAWKTNTSSVSPLPSWLLLTYSLLEQAPATEGSLAALDMSLALQMVSNPGVQAVGNHTIVLTATSNDEPHIQVSQSFVLEVSSGGVGP